MTTLPSVSLARLTHATTRRTECDTLLSACENFGFFYLAEHGIPDRRIDEAIQAARGFFSLPEDVKSRFGHSAQTVFPPVSRGYSPLYGESLHPSSGADPKELFDLGIESADCDKPFSGRTVFPDETTSPGFSRKLLSLQAILLSGPIPVLGKAMAEILGLASDWYDHHFRPPTILQRVIRYPAQGGSAGKHTDNGFFTLLLQENLAAASLRVLLNSRWVDVPSRPGRFVVNLGDMLQLLSDGRFKSTPHEVRHASSTERISIPFFVYPTVEARLTSPSGRNSFHVAEIMLNNFASIWQTGGGAGRARELQ